jgi:hypothetical protein
MFKKLSKTFFFFSEEQRRDIRYPTLSSTVPDANMRLGIFRSNLRDANARLSRPLVV